MRGEIACLPALHSAIYMKIGGGNRRPRVSEKKTPAGVDAPAGVVRSES
jgi:hypothetical protein